MMAYVFVFRFDKQAVAVAQPDSVSLLDVEDAVVRLVRVKAVPSVVDTGVWIISYSQQRQEQSHIKDCRNGQDMELSLPVQSATHINN